MRIVKEKEMLFGVCLLLLSCGVNGLDLNSSVLYDRGKTPRTELEKQASFDAYDVIKNNGGSVYKLKALTNVGQSDFWYVFSGELSIIEVDVSKKEYIGNWLITDFLERVKMKGEGESWRVRPVLNTILGQGDTNTITDPETLEVEGSATLLLQYPFVNSLGCHSAQPLRYGDVNGNSANELVIFLDNDIVIFSPENKKVMMSYRVDYTDWLEDSEVPKVFYQKEDRITSHHVAASSADVKLNQPFPATRSYAKAFFDDLDGDEKSDIVVWRKLYESRLKSDPVLGFNKVADLFVHYTLEEGVYKLQTTDQVTIKSWLEDKNLTWQKGFPSKSECVGQEGQLIPEMHDPLLNDPDVLK